MDDYDYSSRRRREKSSQQERRRTRRPRRPPERVEREEPLTPIPDSRHIRRRTDRPLPTERPREPEPPKEIFAPSWLAVARGVAFFLGAFLLLNLVGELRGAGLDANLGWIDLRPVTLQAVRAFLGTTGTLLLFFAVHPMMPRFLRGLTIVAVLLLFGVSLWNAYGFYEQLREGTIRSPIPVAFPLHLAACLAVVFSGLIGHKGRSSHPARDLFLALLTVLLCVGSFPVAQFFCQGKVDNRRAADVVVVFGCDASPGEDLSQSLLPRVQTACQLYDEKLVRKLVFTGGPAADGTQEAEVMRRLAVEHGIPEADLITETTGTATEAAVKGTLESLRQHDLHTALVVSDFYLLPRIKLCYRRFGKEVDTVPAELPADKAKPRDMQESLVREAVDLWVFYVQPLVL